MMKRSSSSETAVLEERLVGLGRDAFSRKDPEFRPTGDREVNALVSEVSHLPLAFFMASMAET
ncbi:MAG: hypothetical protein V2A56_13725 [bacterium]